MVDDDGNALRYTACRRNFETKLMRYRNVLSKEREKHHVKEIEMSLSQFKGKNNNPMEYEKYLKARHCGKARVLTGGEVADKSLLYGRMKTYD